MALPARPHRRTFNTSSPLKPLPFQPRSGPVVRASDPDWTSWPEVTVKVMRFPRNIQPLDVYKVLVQNGLASTVTRIEIARQPSSDGAAYVTFDPPPARAFWQERIGYYLEQSNDFKELRIDLLSKRRVFMHRSPVDPDREYPERLVLFAEQIDFGFMVAQSSVMIMKTVPNRESSRIKLVLGLQHKELCVEFSLNVTSAEEDDRYRFRIPFSKMERLQENTRSPDQRELVLSLPFPPAFFYKTRDIESTFDNGSYWNERSTWIRETDIVKDRAVVNTQPVTLKNEHAVIDLDKWMMYSEPANGRWTTYRFIFDAAKCNKANYSLVIDALADYNIPTVSGRDISYADRAEPTIWNLFEDQLDSDNSASSALAGFGNLDFEVRYQLEVCLSHGYLNEYNLSPEFIHRLASLGPSIAQDTLEQVADLKLRVYDPMDVFKIHVSGGSSRKKIPPYCCYTRAATVTPTMIYYASPTVETSNRVIRDYSNMEDRFLRVKFTDEKDEGRLNGRSDREHDEILRRVKRTMQQGIIIGKRRYEFLAFGNSQFREHSAYFFAPTPEWDADNIRIDMGKFRHIQEVAKNAARVGQCFSTTRAVRGMKVKIKRLDDVSVQYNGKPLTFTDGVGKISLFLAQMISSEFDYPNAFEDPPSVFQFRLGGCKGILAVAPDAVATDVHIRESQYKFPAMHEGLEVIRVSFFATATLNRQIILVLTALGVPDRVFLKMQQNILADFEVAMRDSMVALRLLQKNIDANQMTLIIASMVLDGFMSSTEPFMMSVLQLWRAWTIKFLKEKARIFVENGAFLFGCIDETLTLKGHVEPKDPDEVSSKAERLAALPEIFLRISDPSNKGVYRVIEGICILARNPSLHPGDVRVVRAVDVPSLHHLKNVVVLPCTGDRPLSNMCSGGDLDGDDYLVMWDPELIPEEINHPAMDFTGAEPIRVDREVTVDDRIEFFLTYIKNDNLGRIAHGHLAQADFCEAGVKDPICLELAELHSTAVDFPKTGVPAKMSRDLAPKKWPHFMEKKHKPKDKIYHSKEILGQLYDQVERVDFVPKYDLPFDERILRAYQLSVDILQQAAEIKVLYDAAVRRIMAKHAIRTEFEVWSTLVLDHNCEAGDYKFSEDMGYITKSLKDRFKDLCIEKAGGRDFEHLGPFVAAMYTVTAREMNAALAECRAVKEVAGREVPVRKMDVEFMPFMSFPWLFVSELGRIAHGGAASQGQNLVTLQAVQKMKPTKKEDPGIQEQGEEELLALFDDAPDSSGRHTVPAKRLPDKDAPNSSTPQIVAEKHLLDEDAPNSSGEHAVKADDTDDDDSNWSVSRPVATNYPLGGDAPSSSPRQAAPINTIVDSGEDITHSVELHPITQQLLGTDRIMMVDRGTKGRAKRGPRRQKFVHTVDTFDAIVRAQDAMDVKKQQVSSVNEARFNETEGQGNLPARKAAESSKMAEYTSHATGQRSGNSNPSGAVTEDEEDLIIFDDVVEEDKSAASEVVKHSIDKAKSDSLASDDEEEVVIDSDSKPSALDILEML
ncbi:hypothetical protein H2199_005462 [Coniosporium tulheliwenetii]|uniref:Uncharacterized protein n=1 Tax=Coniosporium tulheliwenetii TaxID=3383036 RepID=A0ACC2Z2L7_9PEZI|nr:hypothetical protein H2199_005462 [Cladosporium sp. JES 115]